EVQAIFPRVSIRTTEATLESSAFAPADVVEITTSGGGELKSGPDEIAKGKHQHPPSRAELWGEFTACPGPALPRAKKSHAFEKLMIFDRLNGAGDLVLQNH